MKNQIAKKNAPLVGIVLPGAAMDAAARINHFHRLSREAGTVAIKAALEAGMLLFQEKVKRLGTFQAWVEQNCDFSVRTAYNYLNLLQQSIGAQTELDRLCDASAKTRKAAIEEFSSTVESKTLSELMCDYGIITRTKSNLGGYREGAGRKKKAGAEELAAAAEAAGGTLSAKIVDGALAELWRLAVVEGNLGNLETRQLREARDTLKMLLDKTETYLKSREEK